MRYDADKAPNPHEWLELDESGGLDVVLEYHRRRKLPVGESARAHAATHVIVENQAAMGDATVVPATLDRLMREGLDRHDAVHAIGSVLLQIVFDVAIGKDYREIDINAKYGRQLAALTAASWRSQR